MMRTSKLRTTRTWLAAAAAAFAVASLAASPASADPISFESFGAALGNTDGTGQPVRQAGSHPDARVSFRVTPFTAGVPVSFPIDQPHRLQVDLPPGLIGNPRATETCLESQMKGGDNGNSARCPVNSQVGVANVIGTDGSPTPVPVFNVERPDDAPALFAFNYLGVVVKLKPSVRPDDFGITIDSGVISQALVISGADVTLWGVPADPTHDFLRVAPGGALLYIPGLGYINSGVLNGTNSVSSTPRPMLSLGTHCTGQPEVTNGRLDGWADIGNFASASFDADDDGVPFILTGCDRLPFEPTVDVVNTSRHADKPTGLEVDLRVPQSDSPSALSTAHVKDVAMAFPVGMSVAPGSAAGLGACLPGQIRIGSDAADTCPRSSKIGTVSVESPLLDEPMTGDVILASPDLNPFGSLVALYIVAEGSGVRIKLPGRVDPNPITGQLTATFSNNPQLPFSRLLVRLDGGATAPLATPTACGRYETKTTVTSWSGKTVDLTSPMVIDQNCGPRGFAPAVSAGSTSPLAGSDSPFTLTIDRPDGQQGLLGVSTLMPEGLLARVKSVQPCPEPFASTAQCGPGALIGHTQVLAGPGSAPLPVKGMVYLTGPYKGAPFGLSIVVPTVGQSGPFDLGNVVVRAQIAVDRKDARVSVASDDMPTILRGFPLRLRRINVVIDRPGFMFNPTSCRRQTVDVGVRSIEGTKFNTGVPFGVGGCDGLKLDQQLSLRFTGKSQMSAKKHPGITAKVTSKESGTNLGKVVTKLPLSVALDPDNAQALCKPEERKARNCPKGSIVGSASAVSVLKQPLTGPVYFVEGTRLSKEGRTVKTLPKLWIPLSGEGVTIDLNADSSTDSQKRLVTTFKDLPDAPISSFELKITGGKHGILVVPPDPDGGVCDRDRRVDMQFTGQNDTVLERGIQAQVDCNLGVGAKSVTSTRATLRVRGIRAGRVTVSGKGVKTTRRTIKRASIATIRPQLTATGKRLYRERDAIRLRVSFNPKAKGKKTTAVKTTVKRAKKSAAR